MSRFPTTLIAVALSIAGAPLAANAQRPTSMALPPSAVCGRNYDGKVILGSKAPVGGQVIQLSSSNPTAASGPASVTVAAGEVVAIFRISCKQAAQPVSVTISATANGATQSGVIDVGPLALVAITVDPHLGGRNTLGRATLNGPAPPGGVTVMLTSDGPISKITGAYSGSTLGTSHPEGQTTVRAGLDTAGFLVHTNGVPQPAIAKITGTALGVTKMVSLTLTPPLPVVSLSTAATVSGARTTIGGDNQVAEVRIGPPAPAGGLVVQLSSSNSAVASVPAAAVIAQGSDRASFTITTVPVAQTIPVTIGASLPGVAGSGRKGSAVLTVAAPRLDSYEVLAATVVGGQTVEGRVRVDGPAPPGGIAVQLSSNNPSAATVPATMTISQGQTQGAFTISTLPITQVSQSRLVTITVAAGGLTRTAQITVVPPSPED